MKGKCGKKPNRGPDFEEIVIMSEEEVIQNAINERAPFLYCTNLVRTRVCVLCVCRR